MPSPQESKVLNGKDESTPKLEGQWRIPAQALLMMLSAVLNHERFDRKALYLTASEVHLEEGVHRV